MITVEEGYLKSKYGEDLDSCTGLMGMSDYMLYEIIKKRRDEDEEKKTQKSTARPNKIV